MSDSPEEIWVYQEGNRIAMAYGQFTLMAGSIFISASFTIFGLSFTIQNPTLDKFLLMCVASLMLYLMFLVYDKRYTRYTHEIIFPRLRKLEEKLRVNFHTAIKNADKQWESTCRFNYNILRIHNWNLAGFGVLVSLWLIRMSWFVGILSFVVLVISIIAFCLAPRK